MSQSEIVVEGRNLTIGYQVGKKRTEVHSRLNFQLFRGELTCLLGANGAGKSTLLRTLAAAQPFYLATWNCWTVICLLTPNVSCQKP